MVYSDLFYEISLKIKWFFFTLFLRGWIISSETFCDLLLGTMCLVGIRVRVGLHIASMRTKILRPVLSLHLRVFHLVAKGLIEFSSQSGS